MKDVASDIGLSSDSLAASLAVMQTRYLIFYFLNWFPK